MGALVVVATTCALDDAGSGAVVDAGGSVSAAASSEGLVGVTAQAGLDQSGGFDSSQGLSSDAGIAPTSPLMNSEAGRRTVAALVRCALPEGRAIYKGDAEGRSHVFVGQLGMWPSWEWGGCDGQCQEHVSACVLAHVNRTTADMPIWLDSDNAAIGWGRAAAFPREEGSFFGNLFTSPPQAHFCEGSGFVSPGRSVVATRLSAGAKSSPLPFRDAFPGSTCQAACERAAAPNQADGYKSCAGFNHVMTVRRQ